MLAGVVLAFTSYLSSVQSFNRCGTVIDSSTAFSVRASSESIRSQSTPLWLISTSNRGAVSSACQVREPLWKGSNCLKQHPQQVEDFEDPPLPRGIPIASFICVSFSPPSLSRISKSHATLWMGQSFNARAIASLGRVFRHPALAIPHLSVDHVGMVDFSALRDAGCKGIIFDKDNTLTAPYKDSLHPLVEEGVRRCLEAFGDCVCIMSNSAGTRDDLGFEDANRIETSLGIPVLRHEEKKPGGVMDVLAFFEGKGVNVRLDELCFIGDRLLTDVVFGNLHGMLTVHTKPLTMRGDNRLAVFFRFLERKVFLGFFRKICSVEARRHRLCPKKGTPSSSCAVDESSQEPAAFKSA